MLQVQRKELRLHAVARFKTRIFKGEVSREFDVISKPNNVCLSTETKKIVIIV